MTNQMNITNLGLLNINRKIIDSRKYKSESIQITGNVEVVNNVASSFDNESYMSQNNLTIPNEPTSINISGVYTPTDTPQVAWKLTGGSNPLTLQVTSSQISLLLGSTQTLKISGLSITDSTEFKIIISVEESSIKGTFYIGDKLFEKSHTISTPLNMSSYKNIVIGNNPENLEQFWRGNFNISDFSISTNKELIYTPSTNYPLKFSKIMISDGEFSLTNSSVGILDHVYEFEIKEISRSGNTVLLTCVLDGEAKLTVREIGLYATTDEGEILFSKLDGLAIDKGSNVPYDLIFTVNLNLSFLNVTGLPELFINEPEYATLKDYNTVKDVNLYVLTNLERLINRNAINIGYNKAQVLYRWQQEIEQEEDCFSSIQTYTKLLKNLKRIVREEFDPSLLERHGYDPETKTGGNALSKDGVAYDFTTEDYLSEIVSFDNTDSWEFRTAFEAPEDGSGTIATLNSPSSYQPLVISTIDSEWSPITYQSTLGSQSWISVCYGNHKFVVISFGGRISTSTDGKTWSQSSAVTNLGSHGWKAIAYGNSKFVAIGWNLLVPYTYISTSSTGTTWTVATANETIGYNHWIDIAYGNNKFVIIQENGLLSTSEDGTTWTDPIQSYPLSPYAWKSITFGSGKFVAIDSTGYISTSYDGLHWTSPVQITALGSHNWHNITFGNNKFMALGEDGYVSTSTDEINWTEASQDLYISTVDSGSWTGLSYANNTFVAIRTSGYTSTYNVSPICHLKAAQEETLIATIPYKDIAEGTTSSSDISYTRNLNLNFTKFNKFYENPDDAVFISNEHIASGFGGAELKVSPFNNYEYWIDNGQPKGLPNDNVTPLKGLSYGNDVYAVVCNKKLFYSTNLLNWTVCPSDSTFTNDSTFSDMIFNNGIFIALKNNGDLYQSANGRNWRLLSIQSSSELWTGIAYDDENNYYTAITSKGKIYTKRTLFGPWERLLPSIDIYTPTEWVGIAYGSSNDQSYKYFMALRSDGFVAYLHPNSGWISIGYINTAVTSEWTSITYCSNQFFATARSGFVGVTDPDNLIAWTTIDVANYMFLRRQRHFLLSLTYVGTKLIGLSPNSIIIADIDESEVSSAKSFKFYNYIPANYSSSAKVFITENTESSTFLALDSSGHYYFSEDGMNWTPPLGHLTGNKTWIGITYGTTATLHFEFIAVSQDGYVCTSTNGIQWSSPVQRISLLSGETISFTAREENGIIALTKLGRIFLSENGISWNESASGGSTLSNSYYLGYLNSKFYVINSTGTVLIAEHFNSPWEQLSSIPFLMANMSLAYSNGKLMALGTGTGSIAAISTNDGATWGTPFDVPITTSSSGSTLLNIQNNFIIIDSEKYMCVAPSVASLITSTFNETISFKTPTNFSDNIVVQTSEGDNGLKILLTSSNPTTGEVDFLLPILSNTPIALYNGLEINTNYDLNINISKISNSTYSFNTTISKVEAGSTEIIGTISSEILTNGIGIGNILLGGNNSNYSLDLSKFSISVNGEVIIDPKTILQGWSTTTEPELYKLHVEATPSITNTPVISASDSSTELAWKHDDILTDSWNISVSVYTDSTSTEQYIIGNSTDKNDSPINLKIEDDGKLSFYPAINDYYSWNNIKPINTSQASPLGNYSWKSVAYGNNKFIALSTTGYISTSSNGAYWGTPEQVLPEYDTDSWTSIAYGNGMFVALSQNGRIAFTDPSDNYNWTQPSSTLSSETHWSTITFFRGKFIAITATYDGITAILSPSLTLETSYSNSRISGTDNWSALIPLNNEVIASNTTGYISKFDMGETWENFTTNIPYYSLTEVTGEGYLVSNDSAMIYSHDSTPDIYYSTNHGTTWTGASVPSSVYAIRGFCSYQGTFYGIQTSGGIIRSQNSNGSSWSSVTMINNLGTGRNWQNICYGNGKFVITGRHSSGTCFIATTPSTDPYTWNDPIETDFHLNAGIIFNGLKFIGLSSNGKVYSSEDGINWLLISNIGNYTWKSLVFGEGIVKALSADNRIATSMDGITWSTTQLDSSPNLIRHAIGYDKGSNAFYIFGTKKTGSLYSNYAVVAYPWSIPVQDQNLGSGSHSWTSFSKVDYSNNFLSISTDGYISTSTNGLTWTTPEFKSELGNNNWTGMTYGDNKFVLLSNTGFVSQYSEIFTTSENPTPNEAIYTRTGTSSFKPNGLITSISPTISCVTNDDITITNLNRTSAHDVELPEATLTTRESLKSDREYTIDISYDGSKYSLEYKLTPASESEYPDSENLSLYSQVKVPFRSSNSFTFGSNKGSDEFLGTINFLNTSFSANDYEWRGANQLSSVFTVPINPSATEELYDSSAYSLGSISCDFNGGYFINTDLFIMNPNTKYYLDIDRSYKKYIVLRNRGDNTYLSTSSNGDTWTNTNSATFSNLNGGWYATYGNGRYVIINSNGYISTSTDGVTWSTPALSEALGEDSWVPLFNGTQFVTYHRSSNSISFSEDGEEWATPTSISAFSGLDLQAMTFANNTYYAILKIGSTILLSTSEDGINWTDPQTTDLPSTNWTYWYLFCYGNERFVIRNSTGEFSYSMDGLSWSTPVYSSQLENQLIFENSLIFDGEKFMLLCLEVQDSYLRGVKLSTSIDGIHWLTPKAIGEANQSDDATIVFANDNTNASLSSYNVYNSTDGINYTRVYSLASSLNINPVQAIYMGVSTSYNNTDLSNVVISDPYLGKLYLKDWEIDTEHSIWNMKKEVIVSDNKFLQYYHLPNYNKNQYTIEDIGNPEYTITFLDTSFTGNNDLIDFSNPNNFTMCIKVNLKDETSKVLLAKTNLATPSEASLVNESNPYFLLSYIKQNLSLTIFTNERAYTISRYIVSNELATYQSDSILLTFSFENIDDIYTIKMYKNNEIISELRTGLNQMQEASDSFLTNYVQDEIVENICAQYEENPEELAKLVEEVKSNTDKYVQDIIVLEGAITSDKLYYITNLTDTNY